MPLGTMPGGERFQSMRVLQSCERPKKNSTVSKGSGSARGGRDISSPPGRYLMMETIYTISTIITIETIPTIYFVLSLQI